MTPPPETLEQRIKRLKKWRNEYAWCSDPTSGLDAAISIIDQLLAEREKDKAEIERLESVLNQLQDHLPVDIDELIGEEG